MRKLLCFLFLLGSFRGLGQNIDCISPNASKDNIAFIKNVLAQSANSRTAARTNTATKWAGIKFHIGSNILISIVDIETRITKVLAELNQIYLPSGIQFYKSENIHILPTNSITLTNDLNIDFGNSQIPIEFIQLSLTSEFSSTSINLYVFDNIFIQGQDPSYRTNGIGMFPNVLLASNLAAFRTDRFDKGLETIPHELGHYFNLFHTHHNTTPFECLPFGNPNCGDCINGDFIPDTQIDPFVPKFYPDGTDLNSQGQFFSFNTNIYIGRNVYTLCGTLYSDNSPPINNIMSYYHQYNIPRNVFTPWQYVVIGAAYGIRQTQYYTIEGDGGTNQNPPSNLLISKIQNNIQVSWSDNSSEETGYLIERSTNPTDGFVCVGGVAPNITSFTDNTILPNTNYYYRVRASNATIYNCNSSSILPYTSGEMTIDSKVWYAQHIRKATRIGLMNKWSNAIISDNSNILLGEVAQSIIIVANLLNVSGFTSINQTCWDNPYISHLKSMGFLPSTAQSTDILKVGQLCSLIHNIIFENNTTYPYFINRSDMGSVISSTAPYKSSIEYLYQRIGFTKSINGKKIGDYFFNGRFDNSINLRKIAGIENVTRAIFAKFISTAYEFKYYQLNQKVVPNARIAQTNSIFDDLIIIGSKAEFDNDISGIPPTVSVDGATEYMRSGQTKNFSFSTDQLSDGTKVFFYWNIEGGSQGLQLVPMPQYTSNNQGVILTAPTVTSPQTFQFYIHISTIDGRTAEMFKDIVVVPNNSDYATNLTNGEYFIDNDLGIGQATTLPITLNNYGVDSNIPIPTTNLTQGIHIVGIRVKDSNNQWSLTHSKTFLIVENGIGLGNNITQIGYFFDDQNSNETLSNVTPDNNNQFVLPLSINLPQGIHRVSFRVKDNQNKWSLYHTRTFLVVCSSTGGTNSIKQVEYFYDTDPNEANRVRQNITLDANNQTILPLNISLSEGLHTISFRVKDENETWSVFHTRTFLVLGASVGGTNSIKQVEYFYDTDPNEANRIRQNITLDANNQTILPLNISLSEGLHTISFRVKDENETWSVFHTRTFLVMGLGNSLTTISNVEYFIDTDTGFGTGTQIPYNSIGTNPLLFNIDISSLTHGVHILYVRAKNTFNQWSLTHAKAFVVLPNLGGTSTISRIEYFIDNADQSLGNGISIPFTPNPTNSDVLATFDLNISQLTLGTHRISVRTKDSNNQWSSLITSNFEIIYVPCPQTKTVTEIVSNGQVIHQASQAINLTNTSYSGTVIADIKAGGSITIGPNTMIDSGTVIKIYVGGCANN